MVLDPEVGHGSMLLKFVEAQRVEFVVDPCAIITRKRYPQCVNIACRNTLKHKCKPIGIVVGVFSRKKMKTVCNIILQH